MMTSHMFCRIAGIVALGLAAMGLGGISIPGVLMGETSSIAMYAVLGALGLYAGFAHDHEGEFAHHATRLMGLAYLALGIVGFLMPGLIGMQGDTGRNILHLALGLAGSYIGYLAHEAHVHDHAHA